MEHLESICYFGKLLRLTRKTHERYDAAKSTLVHLQCTPGVPVSATLKQGRRVGHIMRRYDALLARLAAMTDLSENALHYQIATQWKPVNPIFIESFLRANTKATM